MKKLGIITVTMLIGLSTAFAQNEKKTVKNENHPNHPHAIAKKEKQKSRVTHMDEVVNLSEAQKSEIAKINKESSEKSRAIRMSYKDKEDKSGMKAEMKQEQESRKMKVHNVLTDEQKKKLKESKERNESTKPIHSPK